MSEIGSHPPGWSLVSLGDIGRLHCGQSPSVANVNRDGKGTPYVTGPDHWDGSTLTADKWTTDPRRVVPDGCIFITVKGAGVGTLFPGIACAIGRDVYAYEPGEGLSARFVEHALRYQIGEVLRHAKGDIPGLSKDHILDHRMAIPSTDEQGRIVATIEELFSDLDAGVVALKRVKANLKRYRASVLKAAVEGNIGSIGSPHLPAWKPIGEVIHDLEQGWSPKCESMPAMEDAEWAVMTTTAIQPLRFSSDENKRLPKGLAPRTDLEVRVGDMVITRAGPRTRAGVACLVRSTRKRLILCDKAYRFQCDDNQVRGTFLEIALNADPVLKHLEKMKTGISDSGVNLTQPRFRELLVPVPPLSVQDRIVAEVDRRLSVADAAETQVEHALKRAARLRQAILKRAFEGRLVPQDPNDKPVATLSDGGPANERRRTRVRRTQRV